MLYNRKERVFAGGRNMRKIKRIIICVIMAFVMICVGNNAFSKARDIKAEETQNNELKGTYGDNLTWNFKDGVLKISGTGEIPELFLEKINDQYDEISKYTVKEIVIEKGVTGIGNSAFEGCYWAEKVTFPDGLQTIGNEAFDRNGLKELEIPESVSYIGKSAFSWCRKLEEVKLPENPTKLSDKIFYECNALEKVVLPNNLESIGDEVFYECGLNKLEIPESVSSIGSDAFSQCRNLEEVNIPKGITKVNKGTFFGCSSLKKIDLPENLESIGENAFRGCMKFQEIKIPETVSSIGNWAFSSCVAIKEINWPDKVKNINDYMFDGCKQLRKVNFPKDLKSIGDSAFGECVSMEEMKVPQTVKTIGSCAFAGCTNLQNIEFPDRLKVLKSSMFNGCTSLKEFQFGTAIQKIERAAFKNCTGLKYLVVPDSVTRIGDEAFKGCTGLEYIKLSRNVEVLEDWLFQDCESLTSIEIPSSVQRLRYWIVDGCTNLKLIIIPESIVDMEAIGCNVEEALIVGEAGSTAEKYAQKYQRAFKSYDDWNCKHSYEHSILKTATINNDGAEGWDCKKCGYKILQELSHPVSVQLTNESLPYNGNQNFPDIQIKLANGKLLDDKYYTCVYEGDHIYPGTYKVQIVLKNGYEGTLESSYKIVKAERILTYDGKKEVEGSYDKPFQIKAKADGTNPKISYKVSDSKILAIDSKGLIKAKSVGSCTVTVCVPEDDNYKKSNEIKIKIRIIPAKVKVKSATPKSGRRISLKWTRDSKVDGYYIRYSTNKKMRNSKTIMIKKNKTTSAGLKNLKRKKKYYIEICGYKKVKVGKQYKNELGTVTKKTIKTK